ncbi:hypothetical protein [Mycobacterium sp. 050134]|uniref:hypothetical protein n=1 Tax=Mycobacterium sp. 050134 TaxID=3096111 RepID=UPI002EDB5355
MTTPAALPTTSPRTGAAAQKVSIGRLSLHLGALSEADARRLAQLVGLALGRVPLRAADHVTVTIPEQTGKPVQQIADVVAHAIEEALRVEGAQ